MQKADDYDTRHVGETDETRRDETGDYVREILCILLALHEPHVATAVHTRPETEVGAQYLMSALPPDQKNPIYLSFFLRRSWLV